VRTVPVLVSRTVNTPAESSVARISNAGLRASASFAQSISRTLSCLAQALSSTTVAAPASAAIWHFMAES
jgi:hypothetical protein